MANFEATTDCLTEDVRRISKWVKKDLYRGCKFVYRGKEDLEVAGHIYRWYTVECGPTLRGYRQAVGENDKKLYLCKAWRVAAKHNTVNNGLALRRSGVYTVMQNRFMGRYIFHTNGSLFQGITRTNRHFV